MKIALFSLLIFGLLATQPVTPPPPAAGATPPPAGSTPQQAPNNQANTPAFTDPSQMGMQARDPAATTPSPSTVSNFGRCNRMLMESYGLDGQDSTVAERNLVCQGIERNCCSYQTQLEIFKKFVKKQEFDKIKTFYESFYNSFDRIFDLFVKVEKIADLILPHTSDFKNSNCLKIITAVKSINIGNRKDELMPFLRRSVDFYTQSHAGFYCTLCDADAHKFYQTVTHRLLQDKDFCGRMVTDTLNWNMFRNGYFPKISRLYTTLLASCNPRAVFNVKVGPPHRTKFFRRSSIEGPAAKCAKGIDKH